MRPQTIKPDIPKPGRPKWVLYVLGGLGLMLVTTGSVVALVKLSKPSEQAPGFVLQDGIPDGFFAQRAADEVSAPPVVAPPPAPAVIEQAAKPAARRRPPPAPPEPLVRGPIVTPLREPREDPEIARRRAEFNAQRRATGGEVRVQRQGRFEEVRYEASDKDWQRYGVPQEAASFPRDMTRLITQDRIFRALLVNEVASDLAGQVIAQIEQPVYGAHGRKVLVPAGSRVIGNYEPLQRIGEERIAIFWTRIITPDGINITLEDGQGVDQMGRSGLSGDLDRRYSERYGMSLLFSILNTAMQLSIPSDKSSDRIIINNWAKETSELSGMILQDHLDIMPRLTIPAGTRFMIQPMRDIYFKEPVKRVVQVTDANNRS